MITVYRKKKLNRMYTFLYFIPQILLVNQVKGCLLFFKYIKVYEHSVQVLISFHIIRHPLNTHRSPLDCLSYKFVVIKPHYHQ